MFDSSLSLGKHQYVLTSDNSDLKTLFPHMSTFWLHKHPKYNFHPNLQDIECGRNTIDIRLECLRISETTQLSKMPLSVFILC